MPSDALPTALDPINQGLASSTDPRTIARRLRTFPLDIHERTPIDLTEDIDRNTSLAWIALSRKNDENPILFRFGGVPVRLEADDENRPILRELTAPRVRHELARAATFAHWSKSQKQYVACPPPRDLCDNLLATRNPPLDVITRISPCPTLADDGSIRCTSGYHAATQTYTSLPPGFSLPPVPDDPSPADIQAALSLIFDDLLVDFPFADSASRAHALALFLLPFLRDAIHGTTPLHLVDAPAAGTGKSLLAEVLLGPGTNGLLSVMAQAADDDEWRKRLTASLRSGRPAVLIDNVTIPVDSGSLAAALVQPMWTDRLLGRSEDISLPVTCIWAMTANNPVLSTELARRTIRIHLDAGAEKPWERDGFKHPHLRSWATENRAALLHAGLTLCAAWHARGRPIGPERPLGSYEAWTAVLGGLLHACGVSGFLENTQDLYDDADRETMVWIEFTGAWWARFEGVPVSTSDLLPIALATDGMDLGRGTSDRSQKTALGMALGRWKDRVVDGRRIVKLAHSRVSNYSLVPVGR